MTRRRSNTIAIITIAGLLFVGAGCTSSDDNATQADRTGNSSPAGRRSATTAGALPDFPEGWPTGLTVPKGMEVGVSKAKERNGETILVVMGTVSGGTMDVVYDEIAANVVDAGFTNDTPGDGGVPGYNVRALVASKNDRTLTVKVTMVGDDVLVNYTVEPRR